MSRNRYRVTRENYIYYPWVKRWWWPLWTRLCSWGYASEQEAFRECKIHAARDVVWTDDEGGA